MVPDAALMAQIQEEDRLMPKSPRAPVRVRELPAKADVLDLLTYTPRERDQGNCGNCWIWGGTGMLEVALGARGIKDRLSVQYFNSNIKSRFACDGGSIYLLGTWLGAQQKVIPWSNVGGEFKDGVVNGYCTESLVGDFEIKTQPYYGIQSIDTVQLEPLEGDLIFEIVKNCIAKKQAVTVSYVTDFESPDGFTQWWNTTDENTLWINPFEGKSLDNKTWGSHNVLIVGYDASDADPAKHHWIVLNSWGAPLNRPNGIFRLPMRMNYGALYQGETKPDYCYRFQYFDIQFQEMPPKAPKVEVMSTTKMPLAGGPLDLWAEVLGTPPMRYQWYKNGVMLEGETRARLQTPALKSSDHLSSYTVSVSNPVGDATSRPLVAPVLGQNLLLNPGFEAAKDWTPNSSVGLPVWKIGTEYKPLAHSGAGFAVLGGTTINESVETGASLAQDVQIGANVGGLRFGFWMKSQTEDIEVNETAGRDKITFKVLDQQGATLFTLDQADNKATPLLNWCYRSLPFDIAPGTKIKIQAITEQDAQKATRFSLDDFALVAEPVAMALEIFPESQAYLAGQVAKITAHAINTETQRVEWVSEGGSLARAETQGATTENAWTLPIEKGTYTLYVNLKENPLIKVKSIAQVVLPQDIQLQLEGQGGVLLPGETRALVATGDGGGGVKWTCDDALRLEGAGLSVSVKLPEIAPLKSQEAKVRVESALDPGRFQEIAFTFKSMDLTGDGVFDVADFLILGKEWGQDISSPANLKGSDQVNEVDLDAMMKVLK